MGKKDKIAAKKKRISEASENSSNSRLMENLKTVNDSLVKDVADCRREVARLQVQLTSLVAEKDISHDIKQEVFALVVSSTLHEFTSCATAEMTTTLDREKNLRKKVEAAAREVNAKDIELISLVKEKNEKEKELMELKESIGTTAEQAKERDRRRRYFFCSITTAAPFVAVAGAALAVFWIIYKK